MITTDTGAKKIEATDNWRQIFGAHNDSVDAYDANVAALQDALGIVVDGNQSAVSASSGQFIILKNSSIVDSGNVMLADGLYTAAKAIPANTVIDKSYLTAVSGGGLNSLNGKIASRLRTKTVELSKDVCGTSWSPTSRSIGTCSTLFGLPESSIVSIMARQASFSPASTASVGLYNGSVYVAASQNTTLSSSIKFVIAYV